ncbi:MAG: argininosuccinate lyase [candidate division NC10 bacterium]|nr:argininosuccinate lyase [candidate division NC10 bacterium]
MKTEKKPWGGRFGARTHPLVEAFTESVSFDHRLAKYDIEGSIAHAKMLGRVGILTSEEAKRIVAGLKEIAAQIKRGQVALDPAREDVHMNIEALLMERIGEVGGKLHTARSRNDQVALDLRLYLREEIAALCRLIRSLQAALVKVAEENIEAILPGYTHTQRAQPLLFSHHLLAYWEMLERDHGRFSDGYRRVNVMPLGAGALAGVSFPIDPAYVAQLLRFPQVASNSVDAVSDRDFCLEFLAAASILMMHLSRLCEEIILWSSSEFGFLELPDAFATGSSMMPQKKNPDVAELVRGKSGRVFGSLVSLLVVMKGLPLSYHRDLQEDKEPLFDAVDSAKGCLQILSVLLPLLKVNRERMRQAAEEGFLNATDLADYLVGKGMPFRSAHEVVGKIIAHCLKRGRTRIDQMSLKELRAFSPLFDGDVYPFLSLEACISRRASLGGTSKERVREALRRAKREMSRSSGKKSGRGGP